ncbi:similar to integral membrane protein [Plenodomus lingam JN3]|uniref:Similar to integral membrane protein n=1 Tax=Leptosphaeria maculans (strain JN3 / isolate v23.1.3 / race Av1-4-5-6-7-8) TaxID=985895 RepID=E5ADB6_LEPMJ|nr:similar to integral membrane protein [Plenodomus lingam JN3]CBY02468.1 similar to integral membrane protein [Plenodomus lingam JN3]
MHLSARLLTCIAVFVACTVIFTITFVSARDPTSVFFNPRKGYAPRYSAVRRQEAEAFVSSYNPASVVKADDEKKRKICVGIPSYNRPQAENLQHAVGSLLHGLTTEERQEIYLIVFLPHSKPEHHPAYSEKWLSDLTDEVLTYRYGFDRMQYIRDMEAQGRVDEKSLFDYGYLLDKCSEKLTPYIAVFEDDTIAADGWYHRTLAALHEAEQQAALVRSMPSFFYLRLFYTEEFLGWNVENWKHYLKNSLAVSVLPTLVLLFMRLTQPTTKHNLSLLSLRTFLTAYASLATLILLFFALGRITVLPLPSGVHEMPQFGCCSQAFVFPTTKALELLAYLKERHFGYVDVLIEDFANERGELRYAVTPSLVQHVGRKRRGGAAELPRSKWEMEIGERIWSFGFEKLDAGKLRREHEGVARAREGSNSARAGTVVDAKLGAK